MVPDQRLVQVGLNAESVFIAPSQVVLGRGMVLLCRFLIPVGGFFRVFRRTAPVAVAPGQVVLGAGISLFRRLTDQYTACSQFRWLLLFA